MAKSPKNKTENVPANTNPETDAPLPTHVEYGDFKLAIADLSQKAAVYLLQYGFGKSLQDSVAGVRKEMTNAVKMGEDGKTPLLDEAGNTIPAIPKMKSRQPSPRAWANVFRPSWTAQLAIAGRANPNLPRARA
jgi:hypothetical protein